MWQNDIWLQSGICLLFLSILYRKVGGFPRIDMTGATDTAKGSPIVQSEVHL